MSYIYALVRTDIPLADQIVQVGHACLEAGGAFAPPPGCHLVVLQVGSEPQLWRMVERAEIAGIPMKVFFEPDDGMRYTAACSAPVGGAQRRIFRHLPLWAPPGSAPAPPGQAG